VLVLQGKNSRGFAGANFPGVSKQSLHLLELRDEISSVEHKPIGWAKVVAGRFLF
jgi:hypothetical protein